MLSGSVNIGYFIKVLTGWKHSQLGFPRLRTGERVAGAWGLQRGGEESQQGHGLLDVSRIETLLKMTQAAITSPDLRTVKSQYQKSAHTLPRGRVTDRAQGTRDSHDQ